MCVQQKRKRGKRGRGGERQIERERTGGGEGERSVTNNREKAGGRDGDGDRERRTGEVGRERHTPRVLAWIKSTIFVTSSAVGHARTYFGDFPRTAKHVRRVGRRHCCYRTQHYISLRNARHYRVGAVATGFHKYRARFREYHRGCRHLSIHSHLLSDVH